MTSAEQAVLEYEIEHLIEYLAPIVSANIRRREVSDYIIQVIKANSDSSNIHIFGCGSSFFRSYLPDGDIDLVLVTTFSENYQTRQIISLFNALCKEISLREESRPISNTMTIRSVELVNARVKVAHCVVNNVGVDITVNQIGPLASIAFLEEADRLIGCNHLFKRSVLLIKSWCLNDSQQYCPSSIIGSRAGMLSTYALNIMILYLFNKYAISMTHPFAALKYFLTTYARFSWDSFVLTLDGPVPIVSGPNFAASRHALVSTNSTTNNHCVNSHDNISNNILNPPNVINRFASLLEKFRSKVPSAAISHSAQFAMRACNIQDPVDASNNLGNSVSRHNLTLIVRALDQANRALDQIIPWHPVLISLRQPKIGVPVVNPLDSAASTPCQATGLKQTGDQPLPHNHDSTDAMPVAPILTPTPHIMRSDADTSMSNSTDFALHNLGSYYDSRSSASCSDASMISTTHQGDVDKTQFVPISDPPLLVVSDNSSVQSSDNVQRHMTHPTHGSAVLPTLTMGRPMVMQSAPLAQPARTRNQSWGNGNIINTTHGPRHVNTVANNNQINMSNINRHQNRNGRSGLSPPLHAMVGNSANNPITNQNTSLSTTITSSSISEMTTQQNFWFLRQFLGGTYAQFVTDTSLRPDLRDHPMQLSAAMTVSAGPGSRPRGSSNSPPYAAIMSNGTHTSANAVKDGASVLDEMGVGVEVSNEDTDKGRNDVLSGDLQAMWEALDAAIAARAQPPQTDSKAIEPAVSTIVQTMATPTLQCDKSLKARDDNHLNESCDTTSIPASSSSVASQVDQALLQPLAAPVQLTEHLDAAAQTDNNDNYSSSNESEKPQSHDNGMPNSLKTATRRALSNYWQYVWTMFIDNQSHHVNLDTHIANDNCSSVTLASSIDLKSLPVTNPRQDSSSVPSSSRKTAKNSKSKSNVKQQASERTHESKSTDAALLPCSVSMPAQCAANPSSPVQRNYVSRVRLWTIAAVIIIIVIACAQSAIKLFPPSTSNSNINVIQCSGNALREVNTIGKTPRIATTVWVGSGTSVTLGADMTHEIENIMERINASRTSRICQLCAECYEDMACDTHHLISPVSSQRMTNTVLSADINSTAISYHWKHNGMYLASNNPLGTDKKVHALAAVTEERQGSYICEEWDQLLQTKDAISEINLLISLAPLANLENRLVQLPEGSLIHIELLNVTGLPRPSFTWFKNGYPLIADVSTFMSKFNNHLMIKNANRTHSGTYTCVISNLAGSFAWSEITYVVA